MIDSMDLIDYELDRREEEEILRWEWEEQAGKPGQAGGGSDGSSGAPSPYASCQTLDETRLMCEYINFLHHFFSPEVTRGSHCPTR